MEKEATEFHTSSMQEKGEVIFEREFPGEEKLIAPVVLRLIEFLEHEQLLSRQGRMQFQLCLDEAMKNAVMHGNKGDSGKTTKVQVIAGNGCFWVVIMDEGDGFDPESIPDPVSDIGILNESGRGLYLMQHYAQKVEFWNEGRTVALCFGVSAEKGA